MKEAASEAALPEDEAPLPNIRADFPPFGSKSVEVWPNLPGGRWIASQQPEPNYVGDMVGRWCCSVKKMSKPLISLHNFRSTGKLGQIHVLP
jgi:hypothetical protein